MSSGFGDQFLVLFFKLLVIALAVNGAHLPSFIKACRRDDPNLNQCAKEHAAEAIPHLVDGVRQFGTPALNPLHLPAIEIKASENLEVKLKDCTLYGLDKMVVDDINVDLEKQHFTVVVSSSLVNLLSQYQIKGRILVIPLEGEGAANLTIVDGKFHYSSDFQTIIKNGKEYMDIVNPQIEYDVGRTYYQFDNLFNGNERLGAETNRLLNENWREVSKDLSPTVSETISQIVTSILKAFFDRVPYNEIFV